MRRIAVINQKGGVGKTTTAVNLAAALADDGHRVGLIDLDPQAHATTHLGIEPGDGPTIYDVLVNNRTLAEARRLATINLSVVGADINLAAAEMELAGVVGREVILRDAVAADDLAADYAIMDCAPSLGVLTLNALACAHEVFIPLQPHFFALHGLSKLLETTALVARRINPHLKVSGIVLCMFESSTKLAHEVVANIESFLSKARGTATPWANAKLFETRIRRNIKLAESPSYGQSIFQYAPQCPGASDYRSLANEVRAMVAARESMAA